MKPLHLLQTVPSPQDTVLLHAARTSTPSYARMVSGEAVQLYNIISCTFYEYEHTDTLLMTIFLEYALGVWRSSSRPTLDCALSFKTNEVKGSK